MSKITRFIVKDWAGNVMNWGEYEDFDDAMVELDERVRMELRENGIDIEQTYDLQNEYPELEKALDKIVTEFSGEYWIDEIKEN